MESTRKEITGTPQIHLEKESGKKSFGEMKADANNRVRWRIFVDSLCS
jgi:hypothetical protein